MEYKIIRSYAGHYRVVEELVEKTVNEFIEKGWKPLGGVAIMQNEEGFYILYQAIIKE
jgi:hypothetical protein